MEELNLKDLLRYYLSNIQIILVVIILVGVLGYCYVEFLKTPLYHGSTTLILVQESSETSSTITQSELNTNEMLVSTYSEIIKSRTVLEQVIDALSLDMDYTDLKSNVTVTSVSDTAIIEITVSNEDATLAANIANKISDIFKAEVVNIYNIKNVSVIDSAVVEDDPYNINVVKEVCIYELVAIVIVCVIIFMFYYFDNTVKGSKEIEEKFGLAVLGEIPIVKPDKGGEK